jgi:hypothetical protein
LESPEESDHLDAILRKALPRTFARIYAVMNHFGAQSLNARIAANLRRRLPELRNDPDLLKTIESAIHDLGDQLRDPDSYVHGVASSMIDRLVKRAVEASRGQIAHMVWENLARLSDEQIRVQIESKTHSSRLDTGQWRRFWSSVGAVIRHFTPDRAGCNGDCESPIDRASTYRPGIRDFTSLSGTVQCQVCKLVIVT